MIPSEHLQRLVAGWLPTQRWYAGKGRAGSVGVELLANLSDAVELWLLRVTYGGLRVAMIVLTTLTR